VHPVRDLEGETPVKVQERLAEMRADGLRCGEPLLKGRTCCKTKGHDDKHSHTWHQGDARVTTIGLREVNMETGELLGEIASAPLGLRPGRPLDVLRTMYGITPPDDRLVITGEPMETLEATYHYTAARHSFGVTVNGWDVRRDDITGKVTRIHSLNEKRDALALVSEYGLSAASRKTGISRNTLKAWRDRP
jgi:hypothetical protein